MDGDFFFAMFDWVAGDYVLVILCAEFDDGERLA